jgi:hypothetical protein
MDEISEGGVAKDINLGPSGDYCNYYGVGDYINHQETNNQSGYTGFTTPTPFGNYQESDAHGNVCQANGSEWGMELRRESPGNNCFTSCSIQHYVSFHDQELRNRPWNSAFTNHR